LGLGTCGLVATSSASAGDEPKIQRVIFRAVSEEDVIAAVLADEGVALADGSRCPVDRLEVSYRLPDKDWKSGAFIPPLGPRRDEIRRVNGVVLCTASSFAFVGFQATLTSGRWSIVVVPDPEGALSQDTESGEHPDHNVPDTEPIPVPRTGPILGAFTGSEIEGYAPYEGQTICEPSAKPGALGLRNLLLAHYPSTTSFGISRPCDMGGRSEHKEGRAFDWGADIDVPEEKAAVDDFLATAFASDGYGNTHAVLRRMGVMYVIWNGHIWTSYAPEWQPYSGTSPHTDHVHISLSWEGALAKTSFWSGTVLKAFGGNAPPGPLMVYPSPSASPTPSPKASPAVAAPKSKPSVAPTPANTPYAGPAHRRQRRKPAPTPEPDRTPRPTPTPTPAS
jgi:hypothetical protein